MKDVMKDLNKLDPAVYAAQLADEIAEIQLDIDMANPDYREDWWKEVLGHTNRLLKTHYAHLAVDPIPQPQAKPSEYRPIDEAATAATGAPWKTQPSPWHKSPKVMSAPPSRASSPSYIKNWKPQPPGSVVPDEVKQPGMEKHRFDLIDWRLNGFEQRLGELEARLPIATGNDSGELAKIADLLNYVAGMVAAQGNDPDSGNATDLEMNLCAASKKLAHLAGVIPPFKGRPDRECPVCSEPEDKPHAPNCEYAVLDSLHLPGMETSRLNAMDWRFNGIEERLGTVECNASAFRLTAMQEQIDRLTAHLESLSAAHESLHNTYWKQSYDVGSRLDALEQKAPR